MRDCVIRLLSSPRQSAHFRSTGGALGIADRIGLGMVCLPWDTY
jgi:hypothetical protein